MLYGGNRDLAQTEDAHICAAHRCELSVEEHDLSDKYPDLCEKHARIAHRQEEDDIDVEEEQPAKQVEMLRECAECSTIIQNGKPCHVCENKTLYAQHRQLIPATHSAYAALQAQIESQYPQSCSVSIRYKQALLSLRIYAQTGEFESYVEQFSVMKNAADEFFEVYPPKTSKE